MNETVKIANQRKIANSTLPLTRDITTPTNVHISQSSLEKQITAMAMVSIGQQADFPSVEK